MTSIQQQDSRRRQAAREIIAQLKTRNHLRGITVHEALSLCRFNTPWRYPAVIIYRSTIFDLRVCRFCLRVKQDSSKNLLQQINKYMSWDKPKHRP